MRIAVQTMGTYQESLTLARWAEAHGLEAFAVADHYLGTDETALDQPTLLAGIARETSTIRLATLVSPITFRHPAVMLKTALTLQALSGGRFRLGLGAGWMPEEHRAFGLPFPEVAERFDRLEEALGYLRAAIDGTGFEGRFYRLDVPASGPLADGLTLVVGGSGPRRTPELAGRFAEEFNAFPDPRHSFAERIARASQHSGERALLVSTAFPPVVGRTDGQYRAVLGEMASARGRTPEELAGRLDAYGIPHGTPRKIAEAKTRLAETGIGLIYLQVAGAVLTRVANAVEVFSG
jgi:alkanesulfonate monooxygenase SsuD/methylene tetrahydromethanopterin reductase-like flavin-dependent oxidoreductase (luciferase family)